MTWEKNINTISKNEGKYTHESYATVVHAIQSEWIFLQRVTWDTGDAFAGAEKMIQETFLPCLLLRRTKTLSPIVGSLSMMTVKKSGLGFLNPVTSAQEKYLISQRGSTELVWAVTGGEALSNTDNLHMLGEERRGRKKDREAAYKTKLKGLVCDLKGNDKRLIIRTKSTGAWMSVHGTTVSGIVLYAT